MTRNAALQVGSTLLFKEIPDDENLIFCSNKLELALIIASAGLPFIECTGALVKGQGGYFETIWICRDRRAFDLNAAYLLVKHLGQCIHASDLLVRE